jgi:hypothetical protein
VSSRAQKFLTRQNRRYRILEEIRRNPCILLLSIEGGRTTNGGQRSCEPSQADRPSENDRIYIKFVYDKINIEDRTSLDTIVEVFTQCAKSIKVRVLFDALDECAEGEIGKIAELIDKFRKANIGVYITTRPHVVDVVRNREEFADATYMDDIKADKADILEFIRTKIKHHKFLITSEFTSEGMYRLRFMAANYSDFSLQVSSSTMYLPPEWNLQIPTKSIWTKLQLSTRTPSKQQQSSHNHRYSRVLVTELILVNGQDS